MFVYTALVSGFGGALYARRAHRAALATAQAEAALVRAELAAISGKLNPHFLFNTLNSIIFLTRKDPGAAERALLSFARMLRYLLDANRGAADRVPLREELDFVRDYLDLETLRLGPRLVGSMADRRRRARRCDPAAHSATASRERNRARHSAARRARHSSDRGRAARASPRTWSCACAMTARVAPGRPAPLAPDAQASASARCAGASSSITTDALVCDIRSAPGQGFCVEIVIPANEQES